MARRNGLVGVHDPYQFVKLMLQPFGGHVQRVKVYIEQRTLAPVARLGFALPQPWYFFSCVLLIPGRSECPFWGAALINLLPSFLPINALRIASGTSDHHEPSYRLDRLLLQRMKWAGMPNQLGIPRRGVVDF